MIKEGTRAIKWTRLSCRSFSANAVLLQLRALSCSNFQIHQDRRQDCPLRPLCRLRIGRGRRAEDAVRAILGVISEFPPPRDPAPA